MAALPSEADIKLILQRRAAYDPKQPFVIEPRLPQLFAGDFVKRGWINAAN